MHLKLCTKRGITSRTASPCPSSAPIVKGTARFHAGLGVELCQEWNDVYGKDDRQAKERKRLLYFLLYFCFSLPDTYNLFLSVPVSIFRSVCCIHLFLPPPLSLWLAGRCLTWLTHSLFFYAFWFFSVWRLHIYLSCKQSWYFLPVHKQLGVWSSNKSPVYICFYFFQHRISEQILILKSRNI